MIASRLILALGLSFTLLAGTAAAAGTGPALQPVSLHIDEQTLDKALTEFAKQSDLQIMFDTPLASRLAARPLHGKYPPEAALDLLLDGTNLVPHFVEGRTVHIKVKEPPVGLHKVSFNTELTPVLRLAQADTTATESPPSPRAEKPPAVQEFRVTVPEIVVTGGRILNTGIAIDVDGTQPAVVIGREEIQRSGASSLEELFRTRLPMNTQAVANDTAPGADNLTGNISLRGLSSSQTLILVDGHRLAAGSLIPGGSFLQPGLQGIALASIERIEILPTSASGFYGGNAVGGVINIILRRDYNGGEVSVVYDDVVHGNASRRRVDFSSALNLPSWKHSMMFFGSFSNGDPLTVGQRDFLRRGRDQIAANDLGFYNNAASSVAGISTNFRNNNSTAPLTFDAGGAAFSSWFSTVPLGYAGYASDSGQGLRDNAGHYNLEPPDTFSGKRASLVSDPTVASLNATFRQEFTEKVQAFLDLGAYEQKSHFLTGPSETTFILPGTATQNPFVQDVRVTLPLTGTPVYNYDVKSTSLRAVAGAIFQLPYNWQGEVDHTWNHWERDDFTTFSALNSNLVRADVVAGVIDVFRDPNRYPIDGSPYRSPPVAYSPVETQLGDTSLRLTGPVGHLPAGPVRVTSLLAYRRETISEQQSTQVLSTGTTVMYSPNLEQTIESAYLEFGIPLFSSANAWPALKELELQVAGRYDAYTIDGANAVITIRNGVPNLPVTRVINETHSTDVTLGLRWVPIKGLMWRASYATGFNPPTATNLIAGARNPAQSVSTTVDPRRGGLPIGGTIANTSGGNPNLQPEDSKSWSTGLVFTPQFMPGFRMSVDYTEIEKLNNAIGLSVQDTLNNEAYLPGRVIRAESCPGDPYAPVCPVTEVFTYLANISRVNVKAYDTQLSYELPWERFGHFGIFGIGTYQPHLQVQLIPTAPLQEFAGITDVLTAPIKWRGNLGVNWSRKSWSAGMTANYFGSYLIADPSVASNAGMILRQGNNGRIPSQTYFDGYVSWTAESGQSWRWLDNMRVQLALRNMFDKDPPIQVSSPQMYSPMADPRMMSYALTITKGF